MKDRNIVIDRELRIGLLEALRDGVLSLDSLPQLQDRQFYINIIGAPHTTMRISRPMANDVQLSNDEYTEYLESRLKGESKAPESFIKELSPEQLAENRKYYRCLKRMEDEEGEIKKGFYSDDPDLLIGSAEDIRGEKSKVLFDGKAK